MGVRYIGDGLWVDDAASAECVDDDGMRYWIMPYGHVLSGERIDYGMAASDRKQPQQRSHLVEEFSAPSAPSLLAEPFNSMVTDGMSISEVAKDIAKSGGAPPFYVEDTPFGWIDEWEDYGELANAYGLDPEDYDGPAVYDFRDLSRAYDTAVDFEVASAEFWVDEAIEGMFQNEEDALLTQQLMDQLGCHPMGQTMAKKKSRRRGPGFEFLNNNPTVSPEGDEIASVDDLDVFTIGYLEAALWSSNDDDGVPLDENYGIDDFSPVALAEAIRDTEAFRRKAGSLLDDIDPSQAGHDFWLTRNGHGAGFWDRGLGDVGEKLSDVSGEFGEQYPVVGEDGHVHWLAPTYEQRQTAPRSKPKRRKGPGFEFLN